MRSGSLSTDGIPEKLTADWIGCIKSCNDRANNNVKDSSFENLSDCYLRASGSYLDVFLVMLVGLLALIV